MFERIVEFRAATNPDDSAIEMPGTIISFARLAADMQSIAAALAQDFPLPPRSIVLISDTRPYIHWLIFLALERLGHISVSDDQAGRTLGIVRPDAVIAENPEHPGKAGSFHHVSQDWVNGALKAGGRIARSPAKDDDPVRITLSSGTTGLPKQIVVSRRLTDFNTMKIQTISVGTNERVRALVLTGMNTVAWQSAFATWMLAGTVLYGGGTNYAAGMALNPNLMSIVPIQLHNLLQNLPPSFEKRSNLRIALTGAAAPRRLLQAARARLTDGLFFGFGASETSILAFGPTEIADRVPGAVGYIAPWSKIEAVGDDGTVLPNGQIGRMRTYVGDLFTGYRNGESDGDGRVEDGWFYSGDLVSLRDDGLLVLEGREDDVVNLGGEKISAFSVEEALMTNPDVLDVAVFALAGSSGAETLHAAIVERPGAATRSIEATVADKLRHPVTLVVVDGIPRNQMGKIMRRELKASIAARIGAG